MIDHKLFKEYFNYSSPSDMYKNLNKTTNTENNKVRVNMTKNNLTSLIEKFKSNSTSDPKKIKNRNNIVEIVKHILYFNHLDHTGQGLKNLTPSQMLSRLSISLAQLKAGNNSEKLKNKIKQI